MRLLSTLNSLDNVADGSTRKLLTTATSSGSGNAVTAVSISGNTLTYTKGSTFSLSTHTHDNATTSTAGFMSSSDKTKLEGIAEGATANVGTVTSIATSGAITGGTITSSGTISHSTSAGYKHIPSGGSSGQYLKYSSSGTAAWTSPDTSITSSSTNTTIPSSKAVYDLFASLVDGDNTYY